VAPGKNFDFTGTTTTKFVANETPSLAQTIIKMVPDNPINAMAEGQMLPLIIFSLLFGTAIVMTNEGGKRIEQFFQDINEINMQILHIVMKFAPIGIFC
jgi:Na+/H+-dicarboxylate symporter